MTAEQGIQAGGAILGIGLNQINANRDWKRNKQFQDIQFRNQQALNKQGQELQLDTWNKTNYEAQREHLENAGLSTGLLYGGSGPGGATTGSQGGGSATGGSVAGSDNSAGMGLQLGQQLAMTKSQIELNNALANKANTEAGKTGGVDTDNVKADTELKGMNLANAKIQNEIGSKTIEEIIDTIKANRDSAVAKSTSDITKGNVDASTQNEQITTIKNEAIESALRLGAIKMKINLDEASIKNMSEQIKIGKVNAEKIGLDQVKGKAMNQLIEKIYDIFGIKNETIK